MGFKGINQVAEQSSVDVNLTVKCHGSENLSLIPGSATSGHVKTGTRLISLSLFTSLPKGAPISILRQHYQSLCRSSCTVPMENETHVVTVM